MSAKRDRRAAEKRGRRAEWAAALRLQLAGWRIVEHRARTGAGEIDLVAIKGRVLAFVEVKERADLNDALLAVTPRQRERLLRAGAIWRSRHDRFMDHEIRFDLVLIAPWRWPRKIEGAFSAEAGAALDLV